jgi:hypothetical protein
MIRQYFFISALILLVINTILMLSIRKGSFAFPGQYSIHSGSIPQENVELYSKKDLAKVNFSRWSALTKPSDIVSAAPGITGRK